MESFKQKRQILKRAITRIHTFCIDQDAPLDDIRVRIDKLEDAFKQYEDIQNDIDTLTSPDELAAEELYRSDIEQRYFTIKSIFVSRSKEDLGNRTMIENQTSQTDIGNAMQALLNHQTTMGTLIERMSTNTRVGATSTPVHTHDGIQQRAELPLPQIQIPEFDGTYLNWIRFRDLFEAMVHTRSTISDVQKFEYLQSKLKGDALALIKHMQPTNDNYRVVWELLNNKYNKPDNVRKAYFELLFEQPAIKSPSLNEIKRLYNNTNESLNALKALNDPVETWDSLLIYHMEKKLDSENFTLWCRDQKSDQPLVFAQFLKFLEGRVIELERIQKVTRGGTRPRNQTSAYTSTIQSCPVCAREHPVYMCNEFKNMNVQNRGNVVRKSNLCFNCLQEGHRVAECKRSLCRVCGAKHNSLLHQPKTKSDVNQLEKPQQEARVQQERQAIGSCIANFTHEYSNTLTFLPTAIVMVRGGNNQYQPCRALLDSGAQISLITEACTQRLQLKRTYNKTLLHGVGTSTKSFTRGKVQLQIKSQLGDKIVTSYAFCLSTLTQMLPNTACNSDKLSYFNNLELADPNYNSPGHIDIILGADVFTECVLDNKIVHPSNSPTAIQTIFGWVIMGQINDCVETRLCVAHVPLEPRDQLQRFWELEEVTGATKPLTADEQAAELHYQQHLQRDATGRYIVRLPFKGGRPEFGESRTASLRRLQGMEKRFENDSQLKAEYCKFVQEYLEMNHMELSNDSDKAYFMPHHAVLKPSSTTTKLRVVFDASCKTTNGLSLNDQVLVGLTVQNDLFTILTQFRKYEVGISGDIEKMYRQILIHPEDRAYQRILWRETISDPVTSYDLKTVTYGTACAPFLATRTVQQVAFDNAKEFPEVCNAIQQCFYVDDFMASTTSGDEATNLMTGICSILSNAGFHLRKWSSNSSEFLSNIDIRDRECSSETIIDDTHTVKTLGLLWDTKVDSFKYSVSLSAMPNIVTKRTVLSDIAKIFDPIGWLSPVTISMKIFMQRLWLKGVDWDQQLSAELLKAWTDMRNNITHIRELHIPRWIQFANEKSIELHGFADSSELAYAAAIYLKVRYANGSVTTNLIAAKTKVAPIKQITLPRLELCAAQLMAKLMLKVRQSLGFEDVPIFGWSDSTVVLAWLSDHPRRWKTFIANRTSYIINIIPSQHWRHIASQHNPADLATRGITPNQLIDNQLWWHGPDILKQSEITEDLRGTIPEDTDLEEKRVPVINVASITQTELIDRYSEFHKLIRITALLMRFFENCKRKSTRIGGFLSTKELQAAHDILIKKAQGDSLAPEIHILRKGNQLPHTHKLSTLSPFIDEDGLLRVGGRIDNADISYNQKHPLILHKGHRLTQLIVQNLHIQQLHAGSRQLHYLLGLRYWIPGVSYIIKRCVYKCTTCMRFRGKPFQQKMGVLPRHRVEASCAFTNTGVDFAGPIQVRSWKGRGSKLYKCWLAVFVCLATKAIHLELVTELSTAAFIATLRRFISRRGVPSHIYSDNGTNFIGSNLHLRELYQFLNKSTTQDTVTREISQTHIQWHFSPPSGPHFGGIWEAGVKSVKFHLKRVLADASATYEEIYTTLCQIESCLNSRPLCLKFEGDMDPLTPAHFLILRPMAALPDSDTSNIKLNRLSRWQFLQRLVQQFWKRWTTEYLSQLQQRSKWSQKLNNLTCDDVVIIKEDNLPPSQWLLGRIIETHPGADGLVRVVTVKTTRGTYKRPITKLCPLFLDI